MVSETMMAGFWSFLVFIVARFAGLLAGKKSKRNPILIDWAVSSAVFIGLLPTLSIYIGWIKQVGV